MSWFKKQNDLLPPAESFRHTNAQDGTGSPQRGTAVNPADNAGGANPVDDILAEAKREAEIEELLRERPIFTTGEILLVKGVLWRVKAITEKRLYLDIYGDAGQILNK